MEVQLESELRRREELLKKRQNDRERRYAEMRAKLQVCVC